MNIAFFIPSLNIGGAERVTALLANSFSENKMNCSIIKYSSEDSKFELNENIEVFNIDKETKSKIYGFLKRIFEIRKYSKKKSNRFLDLYASIRIDSCCYCNVWFKYQSYRI